MAQVFLILIVSDFYDPDGYFFKDGKDEFGGYYDDDNCYHPGPGNRHEFEDDEDELDEIDDDLIRQFERGHEEDEDDVDPSEEALYEKIVKGEKHFPEDEDEEEHPPVQAEKFKVLPKSKV